MNSTARTSRSFRAREEGTIGAAAEGPAGGIAYSEHEGGDGEVFRKAACQLRLEGVVSKRIDRPYLPGDRGVWVKSKCLNRAEFVIVGWSDPEGSRHLVGSLLLGYYDPDGRLIYAGRVGTGMSVKTLTLLHERLAPLATTNMQLSWPPPKRSRFGGPLALSRVHWVRPALVAEITFLGWTDEPSCATPSTSDCVRTNRQARSAGGRAETVIPANSGLRPRLGCTRMSDVTWARSSQTFCPACPPRIGTH